GEAARAVLHGAARGVALGVAVGGERPRRPAGDGQIEALDPIVRGGPASPSLVGHHAVFDLQAATQDPGRPDGPAPAAPTSRAARGTRLAVDAKCREVPAAVQRLDQRDHRALEDEIAELDAK